jgi:hypothetical protein
MGYTTEFEGKFTVDPPLRPEHAVYLRAFSDTRRMGRRPDMTKLRPDPVRVAAGIPEVGLEGGFFVGEGGFKGQGDGLDIISFNDHPIGQPGLWCQWIPSEDDTAIAWNGGEKFYNYVEWLQYIVDQFLNRWGYTLSGSVTYQGEDPEDRGAIRVVDGVVTQEAQVEQPLPGFEIRV